MLVPCSVAYRELVNGITLSFIFAMLMLFVGSVVLRGTDV